jgi:hypothetical protein
MKGCKRHACALVVALIVAACGDDSSNNNGRDDAGIADDAAVGSDAAIDVDAAPDTTAPTATLAPAAPGPIQPTSPIVVRFSESMNTSSLVVGGALGTAATAAWSQTTAANDTLTLTGTWPTGASVALTVAASDIAGNALSPLTAAYDVDGTGPSATLTNAPTNNVTTNVTAYTIDVGSPDTDATTYSYTLTGPTTASASNVSLATDLQLTGLVNGTYTLTVTAKDAAGNVGTALVVTFTIDTQGPAVTLASGPTNGSTTNTTGYTIDVNSAASDAATYSYTLAGPVTASGNDQPFSADIVLASLTSGNYTLTVTGKDTLGNAGTPTVVMFTVDIDGPVVTLSGGPADGSTSNTNSYTIDVNATAADAATYGYSLTGPSAASGSAIAFATNISLSNLTSGAYVLTVTGVDTLGNPGPSVVVSFTVDRSGPILSANPASGSIIDWGDPIVITANEALSTTLADHTVSGTLTTGVTFTKSVSGVTLTLTPTPTWVADSNKTLQIVARDIYGNASTTLDLTYDVRDGGVYVHAVNGDPANPGTRSEPYKTITTGLSAVASAYLPADHAEVRVAAGTYNEAITVPAGVRLLGGYSASDWTATPSRTAYVTTVRDLATPAAADLATVTLSDDTHLERFYVGSSVNATTRCIAVQARVATTSPIVIRDNDLLSSDCPTVAAYTVLLTRGTIQLSDNKIRSSDKPATNFPASRAVYAVRDSAGIPLNVSLDGDDIATGWAQNGHSRAVEFYGAEFIARDAVIAAGQGNNPLGILITASAPSVIEGCTIYGGKAQSTSAAIGIEATNVTNLSILRNVIHGGEGVTANGSPYGIVASTGNILIANNIITGGGTPGDTGGGARGIRAGLATSIKIFNNTIHAGFRPFSIAVDLTAGDVTRIENNIFFFKGSTTTSFSGLVVETSSSSRPLTLKNNVFFNADNAANMFGYLDYDLPNGNCFNNTIYDCTPMAAANLNNEAETNDSADATSADSNVVANPLFTSIDGGDGIFTFFVPGTTTFANDWSLQAGSTVKGLGIDGAATFGFTTDYMTTMRTGNGTTGWSPGAYERD